MERTYIAFDLDLFSYRQPDKLTALLHDCIATALGGKGDRMSASSSILPSNAPARASAPKDRLLDRFYEKC
jgi:hypothetical protein